MGILLCTPPTRQCDRRVDGRMESHEINAVSILTSDVSWDRMQHCLGTTTTTLQYLRAMVILDVLRNNGSTTSDYIRKRILPYSRTDHSDTELPHTLRDQANMADRSTPCFPSGWEGVDSKTKTECTYHRVNVSVLV